MNKADFKLKILIAVNVILAALLIGMYIFLPDKKIIKAVEEQSAPPPSSITVEFYDMLRAELGEDTSKFAVYFRRPALDREPLIFQSRPMRPASMIKMFVMAKAMADVKDGALSLDEHLILTPENMVGGAGSIAGEGVGAQVPVRRLIELMIIESDNTATNILIDRLGMDNLNKYLRDNGYTDTIINHKMMLDAGKKTNLSSVRDLGALFNRIYKHACVDEQRDLLMIDYLLRQEDTDCFPKALPLWNIAHKTGEVEGLYDDGGIFYGADGDFILVIMNDDIDGREDTLDHMKAIAVKAAQISNTKTYGE